MFIKMGRSSSDHFNLFIVGIVIIQIIQCAQIPPNNNVPGLHGSPQELHGSPSGVHGNGQELHGNPPGSHGPPPGVHGGSPGPHGSPQGVHGPPPNPHHSSLPPESARGTNGSIPTSKSVGLPQPGNKISPSSSSAEDDADKRHWEEDYDYYVFHPNATGGNHTDQQGRGVVTKMGRKVKGVGKVVMAPIDIMEAGSAAMGDKLQEQAVIAAEKVKATKAGRKLMAVVGKAKGKGAENATSGAKLTATTTTTTTTTPSPSGSGSVLTTTESSGGGWFDSFLSNSETTTAKP